eukprot:25292-Rhodomonas_salina.2
MRNVALQSVEDAQVTLIIAPRAFKAIFGTDVACGGTRTADHCLPSWQVQPSLSLPPSASANFRSSMTAPRAAPQPRSSSQSYTGRTRARYPDS